MTQILITPVHGTARSIAGKVMTGGHHYVLVDKTAVDVRNALTQGHAVALEGLEIKKRLSPREVDEMVRELAQSRAQEENESYEDYRANLYRFAVEALCSEGETTAEDKGAEKAAAAEAKKAAAAEAKKAAAEAKKAAAAEAKAAKEAEQKPSGE